MRANFSKSLQRVPPWDDASTRRSAGHMTSAQVHERNIRNDRRMLDTDELAITLSERAVHRFGTICGDLSGFLGLKCDPTVICLCINFRGASARASKPVPRGAAIAEAPACSLGTNHTLCLQCRYPQETGTMELCWMEDAGLAGRVGSLASEPSTVLPPRSAVNPSAPRGSGHHSVHSVLCRQY